MSRTGRRFISIGIFAALALLLLAAGSSTRVLGAPQNHSDVSVPAARPLPSETSTTTQKDQVDLNVTVYNSNIALIRDVRQIHLASGTFPLRFEDVAASIMPATVHFRSLTDPTKLNVVEQNYEYDLLDAQKLLQKYVGREITLVRGEEEANSTKWVETKAVLLADNNNEPVWKIGNEIVTGMPTSWYRFSELPGNLYSRPTLVWTLDNSGAGAQKVEASYLANNMNWNADYVLTVARDEKTADLDGWVTLTNNSGARSRMPSFNSWPERSTRCHRPLRPDGKLQPVGHRDGQHRLNSNRKTCRNITSTPSDGELPFRITNRSKSACFPERACQWKNISRSRGNRITTATRKGLGTRLLSR